MSTSADESVEAVVRLSRELPDADDHEAAEALIAVGLSRDEAERANAFVPIAFAHFLLSHFDVAVPATYEIWDPESDRRARGKLRDEPVYVAAYQYAQTHGGSEDVKRVASRSAEIATVNALAWEHDGEAFDLASELAGSVLTPPTLMRVPIPEPQARWWRRSKRS